MKLLNQGFLVVKLKSSFRKVEGHHHDLVNRYGISVTNDHRYVWFVKMTIRSFLHLCLFTGFVTRVTRRVSHVVQELLILPEHMSSPSGFSWFRVVRSLVFYVALCSSLFVMLSFFYWPLYCLSFFYWPLYCLSFFNSRFLITPLVSSIFSHMLVKICI